MRNKHDYVSNGNNFNTNDNGRKPSSARRRTLSGNRPWARAGCQEPCPPVFVDVVDDASDDGPPQQYVFRQPPSQSWYMPMARDGYLSQHTQRASQCNKNRPTADDHPYFDQTPGYDGIDVSAKKSRARRQSTAYGSRPRPSSGGYAKSAATPRATEEDAALAGIPRGYSIKNWDPTEAPIMLLGSVFDANSLGKWIYDWTVFHHGASTPMADVAGELWLLLIRLTGKLKRARACLPRIKRYDAQEVVQDFLQGGDRLWARFKKLLRACEHFMWKAARREGGRSSVSMGRNAGCEFVESIFGRDRELENTEKLMNSIHVWSVRFDMNCEDIFRRSL